MISNLILRHKTTFGGIFISILLIYNDQNVLIFEKKNNHQTINEVVFAHLVETKSLRIELKHPSELTPAALFGIIVE
jgi:hypothetical protein